MPQSEISLLFQQLGEVLSGIRGLHEMIDIRQAQSDKLHDLVRSDLATLRQDQRELEEKFDCMVTVMQGDVQALRTATTENTRLLDTLAMAVNALRRPMTDFLALRARAVGLLFAAGIAGSTALWLADPVYRWFIDQHLSRH